MQLVLGKPGVRRLALPIGELLFGLLLGDAVAFLDLACKVLTPPVNDIKIVIGLLSPLFFGLASDMLPIAFDLIPVHMNLLSMDKRASTSNNSQNA